jgi:hypothetical protein
MKSPAACISLLGSLGILPSHIALFTGFTRPAVSRWVRNADNMTLPSINAVNELAYKAAKQYKIRHLPLPPFAWGKSKEQLFNLLVDRAASAPDLQELTDDLLKKLPDYGDPEATPETTGGETP